MPFDISAWTWLVVSVARGCVKAVAVAEQDPGRGPPACAPDGRSRWCLELFACIVLYSAVLRRAVLRCAVLCCVALRLPLKPHAPELGRWLWREALHRGSTCVAFDCAFG